MTKEERLKIYHELFGADAPVPPDHLLPVIIDNEMTGIMERLSKEQRNKFIKLFEELDELCDITMDKKHQFWDKIE